MPKIKNKVQLPESKLLKAMAELESVIEKGDDLEDQDPEGGLSTEGTPLSNAAPSGKSTKKSARRSSSSSSDDASSVEKGGDDDDDASSIEKADDDSSSAGDKPNPFEKKKDKKKSKKVMKADASSDAGSADDASSDDDAEKSFREAVEADETVAKGIEVSLFLEAFVDQMGVHLASLQKSFTKQLDAAVSQLNARIDNRVAKSVSFQADFNSRLAKAVASIGESVQTDVVDMIKSFGNAPAAPRGKALLSKSEVNNPPWAGSQGQDNRMANGSEGGDFTAELAELSSEKIGDWLFKKSMKNEIDSKLILAWEADRYDPATLPTQIRKALVDDLCK